MSTISQNLKKICMLLFASIICNVAISQTVSDNEIKINIAAINDPLVKLSQLKPKVFEYDTQKFKYLKLAPGKQYGFIAEEMKEVFPHLVTQKKVSYMFGKNSYRDTHVSTIDDTKLIPILVASLQQQQEQIDKLRNEIELLKTKKSVALD